MIYVRQEIDNCYLVKQENLFSKFEGKIETMEHTRSTNILPITGLLEFDTYAYLSWTIKPRKIL